jgi:hypothetical protein
MDAPVGLSSLPSELPDLPVMELNFLPDLSNLPVIEPNSFLIFPIFL